MQTWRPQHYQRTGLRLGVDSQILRHTVATGEQTIAVNPALPPVFSLRHLAHLTKVDYGFLRAVVSRDLSDPYKIFRLPKSKDEANDRGFRIICIPHPGLMQAQRWIAHRILALGRPHTASFAYTQGNSIKDAATLHCGCHWLIKLDVRRFFESISEIAAYRVFCSLGYQPLVAFELARICTRLGTMTRARDRTRWSANSHQYQAISKYSHHRIGHLPQGAPTSPMLSNLAMRGFDEAVIAIAAHHHLIYTRYADDLCLSTADRLFTRTRAARVIGEVYAAMGRVGLSPNVTKTRVSPPGARKVVLGLLVDGEKPHLTREFRARLRQHIYYLLHQDIGPARHAAKRGFMSVRGLRNHIEGLVAFARNIDSDYAERCAQELAQVVWPL